MSANTRFVECRTGIYVHIEEVGSLLFFLILRRAQDHLLNQQFNLLLVVDASRNKTDSIVHTLARATSIGGRHFIILIILCLRACLVLIFQSLRRRNPFTGMIIGIGTDILNLSRLHAFSPFRLNRLATRILTTNELQFLKGRLGDSQIDASAVEERSITKFTKTNGPNKDRLVAFLGVRYANILFSGRL